MKIKDLEWYLSYNDNGDRQVEGLQTNHIYFPDFYIMPTIYGHIPNWEIIREIKHCGTVEEVKNYGSQIPWTIEIGHKTNPRIDSMYDFIIEYKDCANLAEALQWCQDKYLEILTEITNGNL